MSLLVMACGGPFSIRRASASALQFAQRSVASSTVMVRRMYLPQSSQTLRLGNFGWGVGMGPFRSIAQAAVADPATPALLIEFPSGRNDAASALFSPQVWSACNRHDSNQVLCLQPECAIALQG